MSIRRLIRDHAPLHVDWSYRVHCDICGHVGHTYRSTRYGEATDHCFKCHSHRRKRELASWVKSRTLVPPAKTRILEVAPGGQLSDMLRRRFRGYVGLRYPPYDAMSLPIESESMDIVVSCDVIEHFKSPAFALREIHRVLKPGGIHLSAVLVDRDATYYAGGKVVGNHMDEDGGKCPVYTTLGRDLPDTVASWIGAGCGSVTLLDGVLMIYKAE